jgi:hypothetical protein
MDISTIIDDYKKLSIEMKREKLVSLLEVFAPYRQAINDVIAFTKAGKISEQDMVDTYASFATSINDVKKEGLEKSFDKLTVLHQKLLAIRDAEEADKAKE